MTDKPDEIAARNRDQAIRSTALDKSIQSNCGQFYDKDGRILFDENLIVTAAKAFEDYIKTGNVKAEEPKKEW